MDAQRVDMFMMANSKFFESHHLMQVRDRMLALDDSRWMMVQSLSFYDPTTCLIVSLLGGALGIDRFIIGDIGMGVGKLLTFGGCGIWTIIDFFLIMGAAREKNLDKLTRAII